MSKKELIENLNNRVKDLKYGNEVELDAINRQTEMYIRNIFGNDSRYINDLVGISFFPMIYPADEQYKRSSWESGYISLTNLISTMLEELIIFSGEADDLDKKINPIDNKINPFSDEYNNKIFIVHGHDEAMKQSVARIIEKLEFEPIILHEQENRNRTIIEKFTDYSNVGLAIVLLSPDDIGTAKNNKEKIKPRARQNVVFEMGYFIGKLGRDKVIVMYNPEDDFELPSDYSGVLYIEYDRKGNWKFEIAKELKAVGYNINLNNIL